MDNYYTREEIWEMDVKISDNELRVLLSDTLIAVPADIVADIFENCFFLMVNPAEKGCYFPEKAIRGKHLIAFPYGILKSPLPDMMNTVAHEVAHYYLEHESLLVEHLPPEEYEKRENEAEDCCRGWFNAWMLRKDNKAPGPGH